MSDLREALDGAWDDDGDTGDTLAPASEVVEDTELSAAPEDGDEQTDDTSAAPVDEADRQYPAGDEPEAAAEVGSGDAGSTSAAPIGWNPEAREGWGDIPKATKDQILQRERDIEQNMANTGLARQESQVFNQIAGKYAAVMAAEGVQNPFQAVEGMFQTAAELRMGNPEQKARRIANMIHNYGVDIEVLDSLLVGEAPEINQNDQMAQMIDQRMQPVNQMMNQFAGMQQNKQNEQYGAVNAQVGDFAQNAEFINDVRYDMADLMDLATKRGQDLSLQDAYDKACSTHPQVSKILYQRWEQSNLKDKQSASMSISGDGQVGQANGKDNTLGQDVRAVWDSYS